MPGLVHVLQILVVLLNVGGYFTVNRAIKKKQSWWMANHECNERNEWNKVVFFFSWIIVDIVLIGAIFLLK